jgi:hypothetical protein
MMTTEQQAAEIEAVAKALREQSPDQHQFTWHMWKNEARAAIAALDAHRATVRPDPQTVTSVDELRHAMEAALVANENVPTQEQPGIMGQELWIRDRVPMFYVTDTCAEVAATVLTPAPRATVTAENLDKRLSAKTIRDAANILDAWVATDPDDEWSPSARKVGRALMALLTGNGGAS